MNTKNWTKKKNLTECTCRVAWFNSGTNKGKLKGFLIGVVVITTELGTFARIGVAAQPVGGYAPDVDAAFIFHEGAELDLEAAERILDAHDGVNIYID